MNERQKILLAIVSFLAIAGLVVLLLLPSRTVSKSMDFYIHDSNGNNQLEVNEMIQLLQRLGRENRTLEDGQW